MISGPRAVLADDHAVTRIGIRRALERAGVSVVGEATTPRAPCARAQTPPRHLPRRRADSRGGVAAVRELAAVAPETPIVMLLESAAEEELLAALRAGASGCLLKDIEPIALGRAVRATLDGEGSLPRGFVACVIEELRCRSRELRVKTAKGTW